MNNSKDSKIARIIILAVFIPLGLFLALRMFQISPRGFSYFGIFLVGGVLLYLIGLKIYKRQARKCPRCGGSLMNLGTIKVFEGAVDTDNPNISYGSLGKRVYKCDKCELEFFELINYDSSSQDAHDSTEILEHLKQDHLRILKNELPEELQKKDFKFKTVSNEEYKIIVDTLKQEVRKHNIQAGFDDDGIRI